MDEQMTQQSTANETEQSVSWDAAADGTAYEGYDNDNEADTSGETFSGHESEDQFEELEPDGIGLNEDGEVHVGDDFFNGMLDKEKKSGEPEETNYYTDEELKNTPFEQWDTKRLNGDIQKFAPIVHEQIQRRNAQARAQTMQNVPFPSEIAEPKAYTPKELSDEAMKLACEKLGIEDPEDFDDYEAEHRAAMALATQELIQKRNAELSDYQRGHAEWEQLQRFNVELSQQPDFKEFNEWYAGKLQEAGVTAEQVNAGLYEYAKRNGNRFGLIPQIISTWYMEYKRSGGGTQARPDVRMNAQSKIRATC